MGLSLSKCSRDSFILGRNEDQLGQEFQGKRAIQAYQDMELFIQEYIFRFEISMYDAALVHVLDCGHQLGGVKPGTVGGVRGLVVG